MKTKAEIIVVEQHHVSAMGRSAAYYTDNLKDNAMWGVPPSLLGLKSCDGMRIRVTMELLGAHKKVKPHKNPWAHDKKDDADYVKKCVAVLKQIKKDSSGKRRRYGVSKS